MKTLREYQKRKDALSGMIARVLIFGAAAAGLIFLLLGQAGVVPPLPSITDDLRELATLFQHTP